MDEQNYIVNRTRPPTMASPEKALLKKIISQLSIIIFKNKKDQIKEKCFCYHLTVSAYRNIFVNMI